MEWLILLGLVVVVVVLLDRVQKLERRMASLEELGIATSAPHTSPEPETRSAPVDQDAAGTEELPAEVREPEPAMALVAPSEKQSTKLVEPVEPPIDAEAETKEITAEEIVAETGEADAKPARQFDFEDIFGRRLPIWAGGIALAVGGIFLVLYSIEAGLLGPKVRVALSFVFGLVLLVGAEAAHRFPDRIADPRVRQALAGASIATFYAAFYLAGAQYGLIGPALAFGGLALVTAAALGLTFRFGLPTAVLGLVGGFATPLLVASDEANVPVLAFYLALLTAGLALTARRLGNRWLGAAALAGGFAWGGLMLLGGPANNADTIAIGIYLLALGAAIPVVIERDSIVPLTRAISGAIGAMQLSVLVALAGFDLLTWGLYLLLAAALAILSWRSESLRPANALALALGVAMLAAWPDPATNDFVLVAAALGVIGLGLPLALLWRDRANLLDLAQLSLGALALGAVCLLHFGLADNASTPPGLAAAFAVLSAVVAAGAARIWQTGGALDKFIALPVGISALLGFSAFHLILPDWIEVAGAVAVTLALAELIRRRRRKSLAAVAWAGAGLTVITLCSTGSMLAELSLAVGDPHSSRDLVQALIRWGVASLPFLALLLVEWRQVGRRFAETGFALFVYVVLAQMVPGDWLAWTAAAGALAALWWLPSRTGLWAAALGVGAAWGLAPLAQWTAAAFETLTGRPMLVTELPSPSSVLRRILPLALVAGFASWKLRDRYALGKGLLAVAGLIGVIVGHILFKQIFALDSAETFTASGMAERTMWQALLIGAGAAILRWRPAWRIIALILVTAGLAHFITFTFLIHNPLWAAQAVGPWPVVNWLLPAYAIAGLAAWSLANQSDGAVQEKLRWMGDGAIMVLIVIYALSELRHSFAGTILTSTPMTQTEDLMRSLTGIVLALGFLWWGARTSQRRWRIGSLVLMVLAVLKVFLVDFAGLDGLLRAGSFIALGLSLIGIAVVYARQLSTRTKE